MQQVTLPRLETERLILRAFKPEDIDAYAEIYADPEVMTFLGGVKIRHETWRHMAGVNGQWILNGYAMFALEEKSTGQLVGRCGPHYPDGWPALEIGWTLGRNAWGKGYATEAATASIDWIFEQKPDLSRVISVIDRANVASQKVAERLGQTRTGETWDASAVFPDIGDAVIDIWAITREDWFNRHT